MYRMLALLLCLPATVALAEEAEPEVFASGDYGCILLDDGTVEITDYSGTSETLLIPETLGGYTVTSIGDQTFHSCDNLTAVTIPDSVTFIGAKAFSSCGSLTSVIVGHDSYARQYCIDNDLPYTYADANDWLNG